MHLTLFSKSKVQIFITYQVFYNQGSKNSEKEKEKLANMMAFGQDIDPNLERLRRQQELRDMDLEEPRPVDRFDECKQNDRQFITAILGTFKYNHYTF